MAEYRRGIPPPWSRHTVRRALVVLASIATVGAYWAVAVALNRPPAAHSSGALAVGSATRTVGVAVTPGGATTTLPVPGLALPPRRGRSAGRVATTTTTVRAPTVVPGPLRAPHYGTYDVHTVTNGNKANGTLYVGRDGSQRLTVGNAKRVSKLRWSTQGELIRTGEARGDGSCAWSPVAIVIATNLTEGRRWSTDVSCTSTVSGQVVTIRRQETAKVTQRARTQIQGRPIDSWLIERHIITTERAGSATIVTEEASTELFAPSIGLPVYTVSRTDVPRADGTVDTVLESIELAAATPY